MNASTSESTVAVALPPAPPANATATASSVAVALSVAVAVTRSEPARTLAPPPTHARVPMSVPLWGAIVAVAKNALTVIPPPVPPRASAVDVAVPVERTITAPPTVICAPFPMKASRLPEIRLVELLPAPAASATEPTVELAVAVRTAALVVTPATSTVNVAACTTAPLPMNARLEPSTNARRSSRRSRSPRRCHPTCPPPPSAPPPPEPARHRSR